MSTPTQQRFFSSLGAFVLSSLSACRTHRDPAPFVYTDAAGQSHTFASVDKDQPVEGAEYELANILPSPSPMFYVRARGDFIAFSCRFAYRYSAARVLGQVQLEQPCGRCVHAERSDELLRGSDAGEWRLARAHQGRALVARGYEICAAHRSDSVPRRQAQGGLAPQLNRSRKKHRCRARSGNACQRRRLRPGDRDSGKPRAR
jgi:hypothetical protein